MPEQFDYRSQIMDSLRRHQDMEREREANAANKSNFRRGLESGIDQSQAMLYGSAGLMGSALGLDGMRDWGYDGYQRNMEEASLNPLDVENFSDIQGPGDAVDWFTGTLGRLAPSAAEALVSSLAGGGVAGLAGRKLAKEGIERAVKAQMSKGIIRDIAEANVKSAIVKRGRQLGLAGFTSTIEGGGMWAEDAEKRGVENANPYSAAAFGALSGASEVLSPFGMALSRGVGPRNLGRLFTEEGKKLAGRLGVSIPKAMAGEGAQEATQEFIAKLNEKWNDPNVSLTDKEALLGYLNAGAAGAAGGMGFGAITGAKPKQKEVGPKQPFAMHSQRLREQANELESGLFTNVDEVLDADSLRKEADRLDQVVPGHSPAQAQLPIDAEIEQALGINANLDVAPPFTPHGLMFQQWNQVGESEVPGPRSMPFSPDLAQQRLDQSQQLALPPGDTMTRNLGVTISPYDAGVAEQRQRDLTTPLLPPGPTQTRNLGTVASHFSPEVAQTLQQNRQQAETLALPETQDTNPNWQATLIPDEMRIQQIAPQGPPIASGTDVAADIDTPIDTTPSQQTTVPERFTRKDGTPFKTEASLKLAAGNQGIDLTNHEVVKEGGGVVAVQVQPDTTVKFSTPNASFSSLKEDVIIETEKFNAFLKDSGLQENENQQQYSQAAARAIGDQVTTWKLRDNMARKDSTGQALMGGRAKSDFEFAERLGRIFGKEIAWSTIGEKYRVNGMVVNSEPSLSDVIFVDLRAPQYQHVVVGHELTHHIQKDNPTLFKEMFDAMSPFVRDIPTYRQQRNLGESYSDADVMVEIIADAMGDNFNKKEFWQQVEQQSPNTFKRVALKVVAWIKGLINQLKEGGRDLNSAQFISDLQKTQAILSQSLIKYKVSRREMADANAEADVAFAAAYHGTPHRGIKTFDTRKIGTGEGAQVYGWGLYFTDKKDIAEWYRKNLTDSGFTFGFFGKTFTNDRTFIKALEGRGVTDASEFVSDIKTYGVAGAKQLYARELAGLRGLFGRNASPKLDAEVLSEGEAQIHNDRVEQLQHRQKMLKKISFKEPGQLYKVEIPDADVMLHWDKPLSEQPAKVRAALTGVATENSTPVDGANLGGGAKLQVETDSDFGDKYYMITESGTKFPLSNQDVIRLLGEAGAEKAGQQVYQELSGQLGSDQQASKHLSSLGIKGIKYLDGTSRDGSGDGHNYVIFDGADAQIKKTYYSTAATADLTQDQILKGNREFQANTQKKVLQGFTKVWGDIRRLVDEYLGSIGTRLGVIDEGTRQLVRRFDYTIDQNVRKSAQASGDLLRKAKKKMNKQDFADWDIARKNGYTDVINRLVEKYGLQEEYQSTRAMLNDMVQRAQEVGVDIGYLDEYWPRVVSDPQGLLDHLQKGKDWSTFSRAIAEKEATLEDGRKLTVEEKGDIINAMILGRHTGSSLNKPGHAQKRIIRELTPELNQFYLDSDAALVSYIYKMEKMIAAKTLFGKVNEAVSAAKSARTRHLNAIAKLERKIAETQDEKESARLTEQLTTHQGQLYEVEQKLERFREDRDWSSSIGTYIANRIAQGKIAKDQESTVQEILSARFNEQGTRGVIGLYKNLSYIDTMGSPISALTQIGDLALAVYSGGFVNTGKALVDAAKRKSEITKEDVGIQHIIQEFADNGTAANAVSWVFKRVGLEWMDTTGKEALMNGSIAKMRDQAKDPKKVGKLRKKLQPIFEDATDSVIYDLQNGKVTENVKYLAWSNLADMQPIALSEMPQKYLTSGNGRLFYMLKSYSIKLFDVYRREVFQKMKSKDKAERIEGIGNMVKIASLLVLANASADEIKDFILGREVTLEDRVWDNVLRLAGGSKFVAWRARHEGLFKASAMQVLPPFKFLDSVSKDVTRGVGDGFETAQSIPLVGKIWYWRMGKGTTKHKTLIDQRYSKARSKLRKVKEGLDQAENKVAFRQKHKEELANYRRGSKVQGKLNKLTRRINQLESQKDSKTTRKMIMKLDAQRQELKKKFFESV